MYRNKSFDEKLTSRKRNDDYDLCNTETGQKFVIKWSSQDGARYLSKNRYASPRSVSKSVPRRNRGVGRYNINRSLNFDIGSQRSESYASPNSSTGSSNASHEGDQYLSRSAKILRALNINYSPLQGTKIAARKINKSLNFDLSPSPKRLANFVKGPRNNYVSPISKINKTLNFEASSSESNIDSVLNSSVESIDENQNQTPSQRNRSAKKSLCYLTPSSERSLGSPVPNVRSPLLRSGLKEKIDNIVRSSVTPNVQSLKRNQFKNKFDDFGASTPRNLFNDFHDESDDADDGRPQTPENVIKIIPESMSAIKKSHRKERALGRLGKAVAYQVEPCTGGDSLTDILLDVPGDESRPRTPSKTMARYKSPQPGVNSIKQSHKKDKSKRKSFACRSEDEMSETGSIFDYTDEGIVRPDADSPSPIHKSTSKNSDNRDNRQDGEVKNRSPDDKLTKESANNSLEEAVPVPSRCGSSPDYLRDAGQGCSTKNEKSPGTPKSSNNPATKTPERIKSGNSLRPVTPENRVNYLQRIMTDSIKKSHKKIKDINRKSIFKPKYSHTSVEIERAREREEAEDRAATPENTNSSRLLLSQFSSVKKSHRKDKHRRMITGSIQRKKYYNRETAEAASSSDCDLQNSSVASSTNDLQSLSPPRLISKQAKRQKSRSKDCSLSDSSGDAHYRTLERTPLKDAGFEAGVDALPTSDVGKSSPNKRKNFLDVSSTSGVSYSSSNLGSISMEYESAEEEFKIFTPIKKRKSLGIIAPTARRLCENAELSAEEASTENGATRCSTPTTARSKNLKSLENSFKTPERNASGVSVTVTDYSTPVLREIDNVPDDPSGRSTPQNSSNAALLVGISSIKKSHKKDKRGNVSRRSLISAREEEYEFEPISKHEKSSDVHPSSPQPSTSYAYDRENDNGSPVKTPPNCLKAKTYLRLLQTASIKRSHKKVRERKKYRSVIVDQDLSDDGSIFDEAERSMTVENESFKETRNGKENGIDEDRAARTSSPDIDSVRVSAKKKSRYIGGPDRSRYSGNLSDDGSIFDSKEKLESP